MFTFVYENMTINCIISADNVHIMDSYKVRKSSDMKAIIEIIREEAANRGFTYKRSIASWVAEWKAHNTLSARNIETERTSSVDLNEDESIIRRLGYFVLSLFYKYKC